MINELIIHLGDTKTGSTSIQKALVLNLCAAPGTSIAYPTRLNHNTLAATLHKDKASEFRESRFNRLYRYFQESDADYGIVSAEHFQMVDPQVLNDAIKTYWPNLADRIRLISYVRPHCDKMLSAFSERVKGGVKLDTVDDLFDAFGRSGGLEYTNRFAKWRKVFGDRFELRPFVRKNLYQGDVVSDFFRYVLGNEDFAITGTVSANKSLTISQLSLLNEMHKRLKQKTKGKKRAHLKEARSEIGRLVAEYMQKNNLGQEDDKPRMPEPLMARFTERYAADAAALDAAFFDDTPMSDALSAIHLKAISTAQSLDAAEYFQPDVIKGVQAFSDVLGNLLAESPEQFRRAASNARVKVKVMT